MSMKRKEDIKHDFCVLRSWLEELTKLEDIENCFPEGGVTEFEHHIIDEIYNLGGAVEALAKIVLRQEEKLVK